MPSTQIKIALPIPDRAVSPNASRGESRWAAIKKSKAVKTHRSRAYIAMRNALIMAGITDLTGMTWAGYSLEFYFPTLMMRDEDNAEGSTKAYRDGICDALGQSDRHFRKVKLTEMSKDAKNPRVEITIYQTKP